MCSKSPARTQRRRRRRMDVSRGNATNPQRQARHHQHRASAKERQPQWQRSQQAKPERPCILSESCQHEGMLVEKTLRSIIPISTSFSSYCQQSSHKMTIDDKFKSHALRAPGHYLADLYEYLFANVTEALSIQSARCVARRWVRRVSSIRHRYLMSLWSRKHEERHQYHMH